MWIVKLVKEPLLNDFPQNYFPRKVHYKRDAELLCELVERRLGKAVAEKVKSKTRKK